MNQHTDECNKKRVARNKAIKAYKENWPNYCQKCEGAGFHAYIENGAPHGAGYWPMKTEEPCECILEGRCPRCGARISESDIDNQEPCSYCGWNWGCNEGDIMPGEYECDCRYKYKSYYELL